jgi:hypothetical protein
VKQLEEQFEGLSEKLRKLTERSSETSSQPPSADGPKKANWNKGKPQRKRGPKYGHPGTTRNGFGWVDHSEVLTVPQCPTCGRRLPVRSRKPYTTNIYLISVVRTHHISLPDELPLKPLLFHLPLNSYILSK